MNKTAVLSVSFYGMSLESKFRVYPLGGRYECMLGRFSACLLRLPQGLDRHGLVAVMKSALIKWFGDI